MDKHVSKEGIITLVRELNAIIREINYNNCYDYVVEFFKRTSLFDDYWAEIKDLPLKGTKVFGIKSKARKKAEADCAFFFKEVHKAGRDLCGHNRTNPGEEVTKENVYFGDVWGLHTHTIAQFERAKDDPNVREAIPRQIVDFVQSYKNSFKVDWLR
ncbi:hypothetical protein IJL65_03295 [bacterium]|nr:hypothetical protein [bacterium]